MVQLFGDRIRSEYVDRTRSSGNLQEWEKTMLKTFSRHSDVFCKTKAVFSLNPQTIVDSSLVSNSVNQLQSANSFVI